VAHLTKVVRQVFSNFVLSAYERYQMCMQ